MAAKDYLRITLLFPYAAWFVFGMLGSKELGLPLPEPLKQILFMYILGTFIWFVPYTILALVLRAWSKNKEEKQILKKFAFAPVYLALIFYALIFVTELVSGKIFGEESDLANLISNPSFTNLLSFNTLPIFSLLYGYFFVVVAYIIYKYLKHKNKFHKEPLDSLGEPT